MEGAKEERKDTREGRGRGEEREEKKMMGWRV